MYFFNANFLKKKNIYFSDLTSRHFSQLQFQLPYLNPIEMLWNEMKEFAREKIVLTIADAALALREFEKSHTTKLIEIIITHDFIFFVILFNQSFNRQYANVKKFYQKLTKLIKKKEIYFFKGNYTITQRKNSIKFMNIFLNFVQTHHRIKK
ncbi:hypothetical protein BpHYR1_043092 [Brachionus plicatilis]|uniref:Uncharacterized protein n=1 Tax=Brachionus plicatilis TaxID=10195 RepID=A0A3M7T1W0_BRAPC|nr:hypothetical protein BpHYR1_043092 [Brachionus plicatilis]